jgi:hypothetical protein
MGGNMTALTHSQIISAVSVYTVGVGGDITSDQLTILKSLVAGDLSRLNPGFIGDDLTELEVYLILDKFENKSGGNNIKSEKVKDYQVTYKDSASSSNWMDKALFKIASYSSTSITFESVERSDSRMKSFASDMIKPEEFGASDNLNTDNERDQDY